MGDNHCRGQMIIKFLELYFTKNCLSWFTGKNPPNTVHVIPVEHCFSFVLCLHKRKKLIKRGKEILTCCICIAACPYIFVFHLSVMTSWLQSLSPCKNVGTSSVWEHHGVLQIITLAFLLFLAPAGGSNPTGQSLTLT